MGFAGDKQLLPVNFNYSLKIKRVDLYILKYIPPPPRKSSSFLLQKNCDNQPVDYSATMQWSWGGGGGNDINIV